MEFVTNEENSPSARHHFGMTTRGDIRVQHGTVWA